jgi:hypothetical protein
MSVTTFNLQERVGSAATTSGATPAAPPSLDYATPLRDRRWSGSTRELWLGIAASVFICGGLGLLLFGALMGMGWRDDHAGPVAVGASFMGLGGCFVAMIVWFRRNER